MIRYDYFQSVKHVLPIAQFQTFEDFSSKFIEFEVIETKTERTKCFSFTQYFPGLTRGKDNIEFITGFVFDFDNKDCEPINPKDIFAKLENLSIAYLWYHTFSHARDNLRWRLIIPFGKFVRTDEWDDIYDRGLNLIGNPPGIDPVCRKTAQIYFYPYQPSRPNSLFIAESFKGHLLDPNDLNKLENKKQEIVTIPIESSTYPKLEKKPLDIIDKIKEALTYISPDVDYLEWVKVGMALKSELGEAGIDVWDNWSKNGLKYTGRKEILYRWATFTSQGVNIGSLYALAKDRGYKIPSHLAPTKTLIKTTYVDKDISLYTEPEEDIIDAALSKLQPFICRDMFDIPDKVLKELYEWINQTSFIIQPIYSIATAISIFAFLKRDIICSPTNIKTNLYILSMGPSRSGKNNGLARIYQIMQKLKLENFVVSGIGSHQGLLRQMNENKGAIFITNDEISYMLGNVQNKQASSHEKNIEQKLLSLYNCKFQTTDAIKGEKMEKISDPFLHVYSTTTEQIVNILKPHSATSGLLARFLIFQVTPGMPYIENINPYDEIPSSLLEGLGEIQKDSFRKAIFEEEAAQWFKQFREKIRPIQQLLNKENTRVDSLFGNLTEQATKLSLLTTPFKNHIPFSHNSKNTVEKWPYIRLEDIQWGVAVAFHCLKNNIQIAAQFSDNSHEKVIKKIKEMLKSKTKDGKWISKSDLYKAINCDAGLYAYEGYLKLLYDGGEIDIEKNQRARGFKIRWISPKIRKEMEKSNAFAKEIKL